jgi:hypothetical protein
MWLIEFKANNGTEQSTDSFIRNVCMSLRAENYFDIYETNK